MDKTNIVVCVKQTAGKEMNPFDACALEAALRVENAAVTALCMGPPSAADMLGSISRLGVERCILLSDTALAGSDTLVTACALSLAVRKISPAPDMVFCGRQSIDGDTAQVGPELATALGYGLITNVLSVDGVSDKEICCTTRFGCEKSGFPCLVTVERINNLRFPRLGAKRCAIETWNCADIEADVSKCGLRASPTKVLKTFESTLGRRKCRFVSADEALEIAMSKAKELRVKVGQTKDDGTCGGQKLALVWCVGEKCVDMAKGVADKIRVLDEGLSPMEIARLAREQKPEVILWSSDFSGRRNAPQAAYLLETGLCADCTALETDGKKLFMYRPAFSGSIMAKIECRTLPQMATVRSADESGENVILCAGIGAQGVFDGLKSDAKRLGFGFGATRALVDKMGLEYELQIGLTGKSVCPSVYICAGVSGAVQHTCAIEQAGLIIAVNSDKDARIFDYADIGVVADAAEFADKLKNLKI